MTREEVKKIRNILIRIKDPDAHIKEAIASCDRQIAIFDKTHGQLRDQYERESPW